MSENNPIELLMQKRADMQKKALEGRELSAAEHKILIEGFQSPFWAVLSREFRARKALVASKMRTTPLNVDNLGTVAELLAEVNVWEFLLDLPRVESEYR